MEANKPGFNRIIFAVLLLLYLLTLAGFAYQNWANQPDDWLSWMLPVNLLIISIPLVLLFGALYLLLNAWRQHATTGQVSPQLAKVIRWAPRIAAIMIIFFTSLFSLDVFESGGKPLELLGGFLIHNIPSIIMIVLLVLAWKRPVVGFVVFLLAALGFTVFFVRGSDPLPVLLLFVLPLLMVALLFYASWKM